MTYLSIFYPTSSRYATNLTRSPSLCSQQVWTLWQLLRHGRLYQNLLSGELLKLSLPLHTHRGGWVVLLCCSDLHPMSLNLTTPEELEALWMWGRTSVPPTQMHLHHPLCYLPPVLSTTWPHHHWTPHEHHGRAMDQVSHRQTSHLWQLQST